MLSHTWELKKLKASLVFVSVFASGVSLLAQSFTDSSISLPGVRRSAVAWGDFDNDDDLDVVLAGDTATGSITRVYRNDGGTFTDINASLPGVSSAAIGWGDYDGDGDLDLALSGYSSAGQISRIYRNDGSAFTDINAGLVGLEAPTLTWGDYDNDGDLDLFLAGYTGLAYFGAIFRNEGADRFVNSGVTLRGGANGSAAWGDYDNDGDMDLLFSSFTLDTSSGQSSRLYRNNNGLFTEVTTAALTAMSESSVAWGDYDNDGDLDILMAGSSISGVQSFPTLRLYRNNTNGASFTTINTAMVGVQDCSLAWGDFDNDGDLDVALAGYNPSFVPVARIYRNNGGGSFTEISASLAGVFDCSLAWGDYDDDGDLDLLLAGNTGSTNITRLYRNDASVGNATPSPPAGLSAVVTGKSVTLSWGPGADGNQSGGFTYNLRVGTLPAINNVFASMADAGTGLRRLPRLGNVNERLMWTLKLPVGIYYWNAQTIDHALAGSPFSTEQSFEIPVQPPNVATLFVTNVTAVGAAVRGNANPNGSFTTVSFEYGTTTNYGAMTPGQDLGGGVNDLSFGAILTGLIPGTSYHFRAVASNSFGVAYGTNLSFITPAFAEVVGLNLLGVGASTVAWGDYDNDGDLDVLLAGGTSSNTVTRIYRNDGGTNFADIEAGLPGLNFGAVAWGDYDHDGDLDILLTGSGISRIYRNNGGDRFADIDTGLPGMSTGASGAWADFDNDGDLDFAITGAGGFPVKTYRNDGDGPFVDLPNSLPRLSESSIAWGDYDKDGDMDLLVTGYNYGAAGVGELTALYRNDGGKFTNSNLSFQRVSRGSVAWGDYDNDGDLDFLLTGSTGSGLNRYSILYSNNGMGGFASVNISSSVPRMDQSSVAWGDYDHDGDLDILASGTTSTGATIRVYRNDGGGLFRDSGAVLPRLQGGSVAWGDYDRDGRLDILLTGYTGSTYITRVYRNLSLTSNAPPSAPAGLNANVTNNAVTLSWAPATDSNQPGGLTYNVRIGTAPGLSDVWNPMADESSGLRRLPRLGNTHLGGMWAITNLAPGTYYWSAQAVDHAFAGSSFSAESSFVITATLLAPIAVTKAVTNISLAGATVEGIANARGAPTTAFFQYGTTTNFNSATGGQNIGSGTSNVNVSASLTNLRDGTLYYVRLVASNMNGIALGASLSFTSTYQFSNVVTALPDLGIGDYWAGSTVWGDYDNDGDLDVVAAGPNMPSTHLYRHDGGDVFTLVNTNLPRNADGVLDCGDYDNDGRLDLLISASSNMVVMHNDGSLSFSQVASFFPCSFATWVDYDGDGDLDICGCDASYASYALLHIYRNDAGVFTESSIPLPRLNAGRMAWGDYDNDGDSDLAVTGLIHSIGPSTRVYRNDGSGNFIDIQAPLVGLEYSRISWADYDHDGDLDLLINGSDPSARTILYRNDNGSFVDVGAGLPGCFGPVEWGDYDNDGYLDLLLRVDGFSRLFRNAGNGTFLDSGKILLGSGTTIGWADYDNDRDLDVLIGSRLYRNNNVIANTPPDAPGGLSITRTGNVVTLRWNAPNDANQAGGLTYNLQVGTSPGVYNVLAGMADSSTGWRRIAKPGVCSHPLWKLTLPVGTFYWRVQAIDHALGSSAFSTESSFTVPTQPPMAETGFTTTNASSYPTLNGLVNPNGLPTIAYFEYGLTNFEFRTTAWALGDGISWLSLSQDMIGLVPEANYHYRMAASNSLGLSFGVARLLRHPHFIGVTELTYNQAFSWADYDQDGDLDAVVGSFSAPQVIRNDHGAFTNTIATFNDPVLGGVVWGDYDNDGDLDLLMRSAKVYRNDGNDQFVRLETPLTVDTSARWADLDNDGDLDIVAINADFSYPAQTHVLVNENGIFTPIATGLRHVGPGVLAVADFDNDGHVDVILAGRERTNFFCELYRNEGNLVFSQTPQPFPGFDDGSLDWGDYDNDGDLDLLLNGRTADATNFLSRVYQNNGGNFQDANATLPGLVGLCAWVDYDNDGDLDIALRGATNLTYESRILQFYRNEGGTFIDSGIRPTLPAQWSGNMVFGDYDNDGDLDCLAGDRLLRNETVVANLPPLPPQGLTTIVSENTVTFNWSAATDPNQSGGLSYNLRVGTAPGSGSIVSAMANPTNGLRLLPQIGNVGQRLSWTLTNTHLGGTFYWSVQAIDHSLAGSAFATEQSFSLPPILAEAQTGFAMNIAPTSAELTGEVFAGGAATTFVFEYGLTTNYGRQTVAQSAGAEARWRVVSASLTNLAVGSNYHYRLVCFNHLGTDYGADATFMTPQFAAVTSLPVSWGAGSVTWGDYDNDGHLDFVLTFADYRPVRLYHNDQNGSFSETGVSFPAALGGSAAWGDYDNDSDLDLAIIGANGSTSDTLHVFRNEGGGAFTLAATPFSHYAAPGSGGLVQWGDFDKDGDLDLLAIPSISPPEIHRNNGGVFARISSPFQQVSMASGAWADFDKDGDLDVLIAGITPGGTNLTRLYLNNGSGSFFSSGQAFPGFARGFVLWADFDNDDDLDLVLSGSITNQYQFPAATKLFRNNGASFTEVAASFPDLLYSRGAVGDYNNDGRADLFLQGWPQAGPIYARLWRNDGNLMFTDSGLALGDGENVPIAWGDFDNDGTLDYVQTHWRSNSYHAFVYRNYAPVPNRAPNAPTGLSATVSGNSVTMSWLAGSDVDQAGGLTYNLRVGTAPGESDIVAPMAELDTGWQRVPCFGNVQQTRHRILTNLAVGTYYWSVQAVDNSFAGSAFAPEMTFVRYSPVAQSQQLVMLEDTSRMITLTGTDPYGLSLTYQVLAWPTNGILSGAPPDLLYRPRTNFFGVDGFLFDVHSAGATSAPASVRIVIRPVPDSGALRLLIEPRSNSPPAQMILGAEPYERYRIEASQDFLQWTPLTNLFATNAVMPFLDPEASRYPYRFYRAMLLLAPARFDSFGWAGGHFQFELSGELTRTYDVQVSTNLTTWMPLTNLVITASPMRIADPGSSGLPMRFYRARPIP